MSQTVRFFDIGNVASDEVPRIVEGIVNGPPWRDERGQVTHVPVWCERDNGREATTIVVHVRNILAA